MALKSGSRTSLALMAAVMRASAVASAMALPACFGFATHDLAGAGEFTLDVIAVDVGIGIAKFVIYEVLGLVGGAFLISSSSPVRRAGFLLLSKPQTAPNKDEDDEEQECK